VAVPRKRRLALVGTLAVTVGVLAGTLMVPLASASSHREAPGISKDPSADNTDVYAFVTPDKPDTVTLVANYIPAEEPSGGPNFYEWDPSVLYEIHVHNGNGTNDEITYQFRFKTKVVDPNTFLYNVGPITFDGTKYVNWNRPQTYSVTRIDERGNSQRLANDLHVPPVNIGPRSTPFYDDLAGAAIENLPNGGKVFAGQRDDPFFVDLGSVFDLLGLRPFNAAHKVACPDPASPCPTSDGADDVAGLSVHSIVLQVPKSDLAHSHMMPTDPNDPGSIIGVYASASRKTTRVLDESTSADGDNNNNRGWVQVSRLGEPLVNEVLIPMGQKDRWNSTDPVQDKQFEKFYLHPEPATLINSLFQGTVAPIDVSGRTDLVGILLTGLTLPAGNSTGVTNFTFTGNRPMDLLRLNMAIAPTTTTVGTGKTLGVLQGDVAGFPNGRRLEDDVVDIEVRAIAQGYGAVLKGIAGLPDKSPNNSLGDGDNQNNVGDTANHKDFLSQFPYVRSPKSGYDPANHIMDGVPPALN
jgi:hypothetical protein